MFARAILVLFALSLPATAQDAALRVGDGIETLLYGVYCAQEPIREDPAPETANGTINIVPSIPDFQFRSKIVPAEIGIGFGVVSSAPLGVDHGAVTVTVTHPPFPGSGVEVERWQTDIGSGPNLTGFSFDHDHELVLGEWTFHAVTESGEELFFIAFEVVAPDLMPQVMDTCFDSFVS
ncbi:DUF3859 domain-containing protein [Hasllibacter sp. MH4015]|uniref:DUF3859 domain-containing protein n=1 Tax=Hasllibacter sp. MH4015 TaxID=2854029 RepID=UPI001CD1990B|nr:DUF3859 domain-containing protein [Hasllibacter sp. MH4015]